MPDRHQGVGSLARLADRDDQGVLGQDRVAVAELVGELDLAGDPGPVLDGVLRDQAGIEGRAARDHDDLVDVAKLLFGQPHLVELQPPRSGVTTEQGVGHGVRLLEDLLAHEPVVAVLLGGREVPVDVVALALGRRAVEPGHLHALAGDGHHLVLAELERLAGVLDERRHVGAEEVLAVAEAHDERGVTARRHDTRGVLGVDGDEGERPGQQLADPLHGDGEVGAGLELALEKMRDDLGVGVGPHLDPLALQLVTERGEVLDDAVVDHRRAVAAAQVGVGIAIGRGAVGGPPGVSDAGGRHGERVLGEGLLEVGQLAGLLVGEELAVAHERDAGGVVTAVLEPSQTLDHDVLR